MAIFNSSLRFGLFHLGLGCLNIVLEQIEHIGSGTRLPLGPPDLHESLPTTRHAGGHGLFHGHFARRGILDGPTKRPGTLVNDILEGRDGIHPLLEATQKAIEHGWCPVLLLLWVITRRWRPPLLHR